MLAIVTQTGLVPRSISPFRVSEVDAPAGVSRQELLEIMFLHQFLRPWTVLCQRLLVVGLIGHKKMPLLGCIARRRWPFFALMNGVDNG